MEDKTYNKIMIAGCVILGLTLILIAIVTNNVEKKETETIYINHIVKQDENLDDIPYKYYSETYVLKARTEIKELNNMTESNIYEGQVILIKK
jgi:MinD-like ATPase involved in chromosome partitioning or flagellar assembly